MTFTLGDDGTLDTVLTCDKCGYSERYTFDGCGEQYHLEYPGECNCYSQFIAWAKHDAASYHECSECSGPATCVDHSEAYAEAQEG